MGSSRDWAAAGTMLLGARTVIAENTPKETDHFRHGGILRYVLRQLTASE